jgi:hypothetical protein
MAARLGMACVVVLTAGVWACADSSSDLRKATTKATYDKASGRLTELTFDADGNGRVDTWTEMDGARPVRARLDRDEDGRIERWEYYDPEGKLAKVGLDRANRGRPDAWAFSTADGRLERVEVSSSADESRIDRREFYDVSRAAAGSREATLVRVESDTNGDMRMDRWERFADGAISTAEFDEDHDGRPDRRLTYRDGALVMIETRPDGTGRYLQKIPVNP